MNNHIPLQELNRIEHAVYVMLQAIGEDPDRDGLVDTPNRVAKAYLGEVFSGYTQDPNDIIKVFDSGGHDQLIVVKDIPFFSMCEHHMLPFYGHAHIGYLPMDGRIVGLSKMSRVVDLFAHRLQVQERLTDQVASFLEERLHPRGVMVVVQARHMCMEMRGIEKNGSVTVTSAIKGLFKDDASLKSEFLTLIQGSL